MARIKVKDLPRNDELDRQAMASILGGARAGVRPNVLVGAMRPAGRIVDYPAGFGRDRLQPPERPREGE